MSSDLRQFEQVLLDLTAQKFSIAREQTLLELAKVNRSELAYSNLWKFFLTPNEKHGLGDNVLRALFEAANFTFQSGDFAAAEVERETLTPSGKFIDLLITSASFIAAIENKIDAPLYNDLVDYSNYVDVHAHGRRTLKMVLSLSDGDSCVPFERVTYKAFFVRLRANLNSLTLSSRADGRYLDYLYETMKTIDVLNQKTQSDEQFRRFLISHEAVAIDLVRRIDSLKDEFHDKIRNLEKLIRDKPVRKDIYRSNVDEKRIYESLVLEFKAKSKALVTLEAWISAKGWEIEAYREKDQVRKLTAQSFGYDSAIEQLADHVHKVIQRIKHEW